MFFKKIKYLPKLIETLPVLWWNPAVLQSFLSTQNPMVLWIYFFKLPGPDGASIMNLFKIHTDGGGVGITRIKYPPHNGAHCIPAKTWYTKPILVWTMNYQHSIVCLVSAPHFVTTWEKGNTLTLGIGLSLMQPLNLGQYFGPWEAKEFKTLLGSDGVMTTRGAFLTWHADFEL
jgi:hypothetical protein